MMPSLLERRGQRAAPSALILNREPMARGDIARTSLFQFV